MGQDQPGQIMGFPYKIAVLCELRDERGRYLLVERAQSPNKGMHSPIGGKLETGEGESPAQCAVREIHEEAGVKLGVEQVELGGIIAERGYGAGVEAVDGGGGVNWLMFWYRVKEPVSVPEQRTREGALKWHERDAIPALHLPESDRSVIWPLVLANPGGFFSVHIVCDDGPMRWSLEAGNEPASGIFDR